MKSYRNMFKKVLIYQIIPLAIFILFWAILFRIIPGEIVDKTLFFTQLIWPMFVWLLASPLIHEFPDFFRNLNARRNTDGSWDISIKNGGGPIVEGGNNQKADKALSHKSQESPKLVLLFSPGQLQLHNNDSRPFCLWGTKISDKPPNIERDKRIIPVNHFYYFLTDKLEENALQILGKNGKKIEKFEIYLTDSNDNQYIARFNLNIVIKEGKVTIHTQQLGIVEEKWKIFNCKVM